MPRWFTKSTQPRAKSIEEEPQPFEIVCGCGEAASGVRERRHQTLTCTRCGATVFVLPADVYPPLESPRKAKRQSSKTPPARARPTTDEEAVEPIFLDEEEDAPTTEMEAVAPPPDVISTARERKKLVTPFRVILLAAAVAVGATIWYGLHVRALDRAAQDVKQEREAGQAALNEGDMLAAAEHFGRACSALETLGRDDASARQTCQLARETNAAANLAGEPLKEIIERAHGVLSAANTEEERAEAELHALDLFAGRWIVMETTMVPVGDAGAWVFDYPLAIEGTPVELDASLPALSPLHSGEQPQRVLLACQLRRCSLRPGSRPALVVEFDAETAFLWANAETLESIGFLSGNEESVTATRTLLERQRQMLEVGP